MKTSSKTTLKMTINEQPLTSFPWICFRTGFNTLQEIADAYDVDFEALATMEKETRATRARYKVLTGIVQSLNRNPIVYEGKSYTLKEFAEKLGIPYSAVQARHKRGMTPEQIASMPYKGRKDTKIYYVSGKAYYGIGELADAFGVKRVTVQSRLAKGMSATQAVLTPIKKSKREHEIFWCLGRTYTSLDDVAKFHGVSLMTLIDKMERFPKKRLDDVVLMLTNKPSYEYIVYGKGYTNLTHIAEAFGLKYATLHTAIRSGKYNTIEEIVEYYNEERCKYYYKGVGYNSLKALSEATGISAYYLNKGLKAGKTVEKIVK